MADDEQSNVSVNIPLTVTVPTDVIDRIQYGGCSPHMLRPVPVALREYRIRTIKTALSDPTTSTTDHFSDHAGPAPNTAEKFEVIHLRAQVHAHYLDFRLEVTRVEFHGEYLGDDDTLGKYGEKAGSVLMMQFDFDKLAD
ncbi:hypothetical protein DOTSEDRAFT_28381 [Dothistroma septosporum NZE10]|uniref:Ubiquitin-like domain-containing protein n=1 Tax=Dothistroma septosporum (strain NZE10 / CBS 128990) TaxID=675120 RepID=M2YJU1_DOTSN|nr:hypothetical protein DOTSEDRAFT_28381 [Dothistroma septosporum NZE10]